MCALVVFNHPVSIRLAVDFEERSLIVHYDIERAGEEPEPRKKRIRMKPFAPGADMNALASAIIKGCGGLVPGSEAPVLVELLHELRHHDEASTTGSQPPAAAPVPAAAPAGAARRPPSATAPAARPGAGAGSGGSVGGPSVGGAGAMPVPSSNRPGSARPGGAALPQHPGAPTGAAAAAAAAAAAGGRLGRAGSVSGGLVGPAGAGTGPGGRSLSAESSGSEAARTAIRRTGSSRGSGGSFGAAEGKDSRDSVGDGGSYTSGASSGASVPVPLEPESEEEPESGDEGARMDDIDAYAEALYEEDPAVRVRGASLLLALAKQPRTLAALAQQGQLLGTLARVLREEGRKSADLALPLMQLFYCFSHFSQLHAALVDLRLGDLAMRSVELELRRATARALDLERLEALAALQAAGDASGEASFRAADIEARKAEEAAAEAAAASAAARSAAATERAERAARRSATAAAAAADGYGDDGGWGDDGGGGWGDGDGDDGDDGRPASAASGGGAGGAGGGVTGGGGATSKRIRLKPLPPGRVDIDKERRRNRVLSRKQEGLVYASLGLLMNLAEDVALERKMCKRDVAGLLVPLLARDNPRLLLLALAFLRKLSVFEENKDAMAALGVAPRLVALLPQPGDIPSLRPKSTRTRMHASALHLIFNLTFDRALCGQFVACGLLRRLPAMLRAPPFRATGIKVLYHLSCCGPDVLPEEHAAAAAAALAAASAAASGRPYPQHAPEPPLSGWGGARGVMASTETPSVIWKLALAFPSPLLPPELAALLVNLCWHAATAETICRAAAGASSASGGGDGLRPLVSRAVKAWDPLALKALRGLAQFTYSWAADACLRAAADEEVAWADAAAMEVREQRAAARAATREARARARAAGAGAGAGGASDGKRGGAGGGKEDDDDADGDHHGDDDDAEDEAAEAEAEAAAEAEAVANAPPLPDEAIEFEYPWGGLWAPCVRDLARFTARASEAASAAGPAGGAAAGGQATAAAAAAASGGRAGDCLVEALGVLACMGGRDMPDSMTQGDLLGDPALVAALERCLGGSSSSNISGKDGAGAGAGKAAGGSGSLLGSAAASPPPGSEDDVVLEALQFVAALAVDPESAPALAASRIPVLLAGALGERGPGVSPDPELQSQAVCAVLRMLHHEATRDALLAPTCRVPLLAAELVAHPVPQLAADADECVHIMIVSCYASVKALALGLRCTCAVFMRLKERAREAGCFLAVLRAVLPCWFCCAHSYCFLLFRVLLAVAFSLLADPASPAAGVRPRPHARRRWAVAGAAGAPLPAVQP